MLTLDASFSFFSFRHSLKPNHQFLSAISTWGHSLKNWATELHKWASWLNGGIPFFFMRPSLTRGKFGDTSTDKNPHKSLASVDRLPQYGGITSSIGWGCCGCSSGGGCVGVMFFAFSGPIAGGESTSISSSVYMPRIASGDNRRAALEEHREKSISLGYFFHISPDLFSNPAVLASSIVYSICEDCFPPLQNSKQHLLSELSTIL